MKLVGEALDEVRRELWNQLRRLPDERWAKDFKGSRWALLKNPEDLTDTQAAQLARIRRNRGGIWRAYEMKEQFRAILAGDLDRDEAGVVLDRWCARAQRSRLAPFVKAARTWQVANGNGGGETNQARDRRIDYVFVGRDSGFPVGTVVVDYSTEGASDHYPVIAEI